MSTTLKPLEADGVPGQLCQEDKNSVAVGSKVHKRLVLPIPLFPKMTPLIPRGSANR